MTELPDNGHALTWDEEEGFALLIPQGPGDEEVPVQAIILTAIFMRLENDTAFVKEQLEWFDAQVAKAEERGLDAE